MGRTLIRRMLQYGWFFGLICGLPQHAHANDQDALQPLPANQWSADMARHLLERAGFGGTPKDVALLARMTPTEAVRSLVRYQRVPDAYLPLEASEAHDEGLEPFASSRPAATDLARATG